MDIAEGADDDDGAAAALASAAAAAADMSKELLGTLPLEEVKKRTIFQQQVPRPRFNTSHSPLRHPHPSPALTRAQHVSASRAWEPRSKTTKFDPGGL
jgi:hypothetical protein